MNAPRCIAGFTVLVICFSANMLFGQSPARSSCLLRPEISTIEIEKTKVETIQVERSRTEKALMEKTRKERPAFEKGQRDKSAFESAEFENCFYRQTKPMDIFKDTFPAEKQTTAFQRTSGVRGSKVTITQRENPRPPKNMTRNRAGKYW